jgi:hypothetical protein
LERLVLLEQRTTMVAVVALQHLVRLQPLMAVAAVDAELLAVKTAVVAVVQEVLLRVKQHLVVVALVEWAD